MFNHNANLLNGSRVTMFEVFQTQGPGSKQWVLFQWIESHMPICYTAYTYRFSIDSENRRKLQFVHKIYTTDKIRTNITMQFQLLMTYLYFIEFWVIQWRIGVLESKNVKLFYYYVVVFKISRILTYTWSYANQPLLITLTHNCIIIRSSLDDSWVSFRRICWKFLEHFFF